MVILHVFGTQFPYFLVVDKTSKQKVHRLITETLFINTMITTSWSVNQTLANGSIKQNYQGADRYSWFSATTFLPSSSIASGISHCCISVTGMNADLHWSSKTIIVFTYQGWTDCFLNYQLVDNRLKILYILPLSTALVVFLKDSFFLLQR